MTEAEWWASEEPAAMATFALKSARASDRVLRLFLAAFWRWQGARLRTAVARESLVSRVPLIEQWAETGIAPPEATEYYDAHRVVYFEPDPKEGVASTARAPAGWGKRGKPAVRRATVLLREVFGPLPFREVAIDPEWRTSTVVALATGIYEERAFDRMPILADALQDAGCEDADVLTHCREPKAIHARGCWVLDSLLGK